MRPKALAVAALIVALLSLPFLWKRHQAEKANSTVEMSLEIAEVKILCRSQDMSVTDFLAQARQAGVTALSLYENTPSTLNPADITLDSLRHFERAARQEGSFSQDEVELARQNGLDLVLRASNGTPEHLSQLLSPFANSSVGPILSPIGEEMFGYPDSLPAAAELIRRGHFRLAMVEFSPQKGFDEVAHQVPESIVRTHSIEVVEMRKLGPDRSRARWLRAVHERTMRLLYMHLLPEKNAAENIEIIRSLAESLQERGFHLGIASGPKAPVHGILWRQVLGFFIAILFPLGALRAAVQWPDLSPSARFFLMSAITSAGGLAIAALGYCLPFMNGVELFRGVKLELTLPVLLAAWVLMDRRDIEESLHKPVLYWEAIAACLAVGAVGLLIVRSGNAGADLAPGFEGHLRDTLQQVFLVRPRFKEFLIGHPLMVAGLLQRDGTQAGNRRSLWMIIPGMVGQTSLLNTFSHFHIPVEISLFRVGLGLGLGYVLGQLVACAADRCARSRA